MKVVKFLLSSLIHVTAGAVLAAVAALIIVTSMGYRPYVVQSGSMEPEIKTASVCLIDTRHDYDALEVGDVIAFTNGRISVTHRIYEFRNELIRTKGDANDGPDQYFISKENYLGCYVGSMPYAGYAVAWLQTKRGIILTVTAGVTLMLLDLLVDKICREKQISIEGRSAEKSIQQTGGGV